MNKRFDLKAAAAEMKRGDEIRLGDGLALRSQGGEPHYCVRYCLRVGGRAVARKRHVIGPFSTASPEAARREAIKIIKEAKLGVDPAAAKAVVPTFGEHAEAFMARHLPTLKGKNGAAKWRNQLVNHCKPIWRLPVDAIERKHVLACLEPIWRTIGASAEEVRSRVARVIDDATARGLREGYNPAKWDDVLKAALGPPPRRGQTRGSMASVSFAELPDLVAELAARGADNQTARALAAVALSCVRSQEFLGMRACELDLAGERAERLGLPAGTPTWTIPHERLKVSPHKEDFVVPLAPQLVAVLEAQLAYVKRWLREVDVVWAASLQGTRPELPRPEVMSGAAMLRYLQRTMGLDATVHGFRASFRTWADDQFAEGSDATPKYHPFAVEFCLAHQPGTKVQQAYRRGMMLKARVAIMRDWADHLLPPKRAAKVVKLREVA